MADNLPLDTSIAVPAVAAVIRVSSFPGGGEGGGEVELSNVEVKDRVGSSTLSMLVDTDASRLGHDALDMSSQKGAEGDGAAGIDPVFKHSPTLPAMSHSVVTNEPNLKSKDDAAGPTASATQAATTSPQVSATPAQLALPPVKRFSSVNINKRFLEKTSSSLGTPQGGSTHSGSGTTNVNGSGHRRGTSPSSRSPSNDRPPPSRLVTAKLTAIPQPSVALTSGWLRTVTPGSSTGPTPPSSSPQPLHDAANTPSLQPPVKRRPGESLIPNGHTNPVPSQGSQQGNKLAWGKVPATPSQGGLNNSGPGPEIQNDFPTAAEAVHGRKLKAIKASDAETAAAAQKAAQKQAMNETAAAFRGAHLDANVRHWDEMEDEDNDFLDGVIEFGDGTQYKIEQKHSTDEPPQADLTPISPIAAEAQQPVTKEERFGQDIGRNWPRGKSSPVQPTFSGSLPPRLAGLQPTGSHHSPTDGSASGSPHSPQDVTSPTSRVLFNERSNRLEPWSNAKIPFMPPRQQGPAHLQGREAPPQPQSVSNVQLLLKGPSGPDSAWKSGPPRGFGSGAERGRWGEGGPSRGLPSASAKEDGQPRELHRRESVSSAAGSSVRERSRGREGRWDTSTPLAAGTDRRDRGRRDSNISQPPIPILPNSLTRERSRERARQLPSHLRMPPPPVPAMRGGSERDLPQRLSATSPAMSARSLTSPVSERPVPVLPMNTESIAETPVSEVDKDALVKDAMHLAIERAKKRKQDGEEEEKRRLEAQERAKKKADELAARLDEKKPDALPLTRPVRDTQEPPVLLVKADPLPSHPVEDLKDNKVVETSSTSHSTSRILQTRHAPTPLLRKPTDASPAAQADSWRRGPVLTGPAEVSTIKLVAKTDTDVAANERAQQPLSIHSPRSPVPARRGILPSITEFTGLDLSVKPDEKLEIVEFCDLGKFMGDLDPAPAPAPTEPSIDIEVPPQAEPSFRARRPVASDFFDVDASTYRSDSVQLPKSEQTSWRRSVVTAGVPTSPPVDELRTQSMPIFSTEESVLVKELGSNFDSKRPVSPTASPSKRVSSHGDQASLTSQSTHMSPVVAALRSPKTSHFKEAPMSTLTDTMSRIKGALVGMQAQDVLSVPSIRETLDKFPDGRSSLPMDMLDSSTMLWRPQQDTLKARPGNKASSIVIAHTVPAETFDVTRSPLPTSPRPVWNTFTVKFPKISYLREVLSRRQLHFWNLPSGPVRWDILSWDPPVEGMNKRELSRDELFHRRHYIKGGKIRILFPCSRISPQDFQSPQEIMVTTRQTLITEAGVKIKLPNVSLPGGRTHRSALVERPRDSSTVPSWRRSATPLISLKAQKVVPIAVNGNVADHELNTTSRSPPPDPSTPLPHFSKSKTAPPTRPQSVKSATVSLPAIDVKALFSRRSSSGPDVAFFRTSKGDPDTDKSKPLPRFTVTSELDSSELPQTASMKTGSSSDSGVTMSKTVSTFSPRQSSAEMAVPHLVGSKSESKSSDELGSTIRSQTPPAAHSNATWGKSPLSFSLKESPGRRAPDPEHLKAVWSQSSGHPSGSTSNSLKGITDDLPSIPFTVQDMKSEDGGTPPPTAPVPPPSRLSLQEVTRAFQQVPDSPANRQASYAQTPLLPQSHRPNQPMGVSLPPPPGRPAFAPYPHTMLGHSPSPTLMYAPGVASPVAHHRMAVNGPSPPIAHGMWLPTPPPAQPGSFIRTAGAPPGQIMYPSARPGPPSQLVHRNPGSMAPPTAPMYAHQMDLNHMHSRSPHIPHAHPVGHPMQHMHVTHVFPPPQPGQAMYAVPVGAGRDGLIPRSGYEGYSSVPLNPGYQQVPTTSFVFQS